MDLQLPTKLRQEVNHALTIQKQGGVSNQQEYVERIIRQHMPSLRIEREASIEGYCCDMVDRHKSLIIEFNGPYHYLRGSRSETGNEQLRMQFLRKLQWNIVVIPHWEIDAKSDQDVTRYVTSKLKAFC